MRRLRELAWTVRSRPVTVIFVGARFPEIPELEKEVKVLDLPLPEEAETSEILAREELFVVVSDAFLTETARLADVVLPAAMWGEKTGTLTNALTLSGAAVNFPGVDVELKEVQPGHLFSAVVTFPEGYNPPVGQPVEVTFKSNQRRMPEVKVPVVSFPRPVAAATPTPAQPPVPKPGVSNAPVTQVTPALPVIR